MLKQLFSTLMIAAMLTGVCPGPMADAPNVVELYTAEDLLQMGENPTADYVLMADVDMAGVEWTPVDLQCGSFDGNGHTILNLTIQTVGNTTDISYDGNRKTYDTSFAGFFGVLKDATVSNLNLLNIRASVESDTPTFLGSIVGGMYDSQLVNCTVSGVLELRAYDRMFGVGGIAGYGSGSMEGCVSDMTLICVDTGEDTLDEQFLGGAYATGFIDVIDCHIGLDAYVSEFGYVHNGGMIGMVMQYPLGEGRRGQLTGNTVSGKITFFECNKDRRAYCDPYVGETLASSLSRKNNNADFKRDERKDYSVTLRPEMCESPTYAEVTTAPGCDSFGYTEYTCQGCGYSYRDNYTLPQHTVTEWVLTKEPTVEEFGISTGNCDGCGLEFTREEDKLIPPEPETEPPATVASETTIPAPEAEPQEKQSQPMWLYAAGGAVVLVAALLLRPRKKGKYQK